MDKRTAQKKRRRHRSAFASKSVVLVLACALLVCGIVGGTVAWLNDDTESVVNTFTISDIEVKLEETTNEFKMIPGWDIKKDPKAWVETGSEPAILFVKVEKSENFDAFMKEIEIAEGWFELTLENAGYEVYYREVATDDEMGEANAFGILAGDKVTVKSEVTKGMMEAFDLDKDGALSEAEEEGLPKLTFTGYAHQLYKDELLTKFEAAEAWANLNSGN